MAEQVALPGEDPALLAKLADESEDIFGLELAAPELYGPFVGWSSGYADDTEFGEETRKCVQKWEGKQTVPCLWEHDVVMKRSSPETGKVVYSRIRPRGGRSWTSACRALLACLQEAWVGRSGPMPAAHSDYFGFTTESNPPLLASGRSGEQALEIYESGIGQLEEALGHMDLEPDDPGYAAQEHNRRLYEAMLRHARLMVRHW